MATIPKVLTYEEWLKMPEVQDGIEEVVNGEVRIMPPNKASHGDVVDNLYDIVRPQIDPKMTRVRISNFGIVIRKDPLTTRAPDLAIFIRSNIVLIDGYFHSAPELVVEVLSPSNTRGEIQGKLRDYASIGVPEAWILSGEARTIEILHLNSNGDLETAGILNEGEIRPKLFPHIIVDVGAIWPD